METLYLLARGPLCWATAIIFVLAMGWKLSKAWSEAKAKDGSSVAYLSWKFGLRSIFNWAIPYNALGWKENPLICAATFCLHLSLLLLVLFADGHTVLWEYTFGLRIWALSPMLSDILSVVALTSLGVLAWRRIAVPQVKFVTGPADWLALILVTVPVLTGFLSGFLGGTSALTLTTLHILTAEILIVLIPFTRLSHAVFIFFTRAYIGSEFGGVRHCRDW
ncbi:MAG: nitrate reductase [Deltaproteobacteria bacterium]|nr:nitrate reductase [Deltaproteobacteria bacterium]